MHVIGARQLEAAGASVPLINSGVLKILSVTVFLMHIPHLLCVKQEGEFGGSEFPRRERRLHQQFESHNREVAVLVLNDVSVMRLHSRSQVGVVCLRGTGESASKVVTSVDIDTTVRRSECHGVGTLFATEKEERRGLTEDTVLELTIPDTVASCQTICTTLQVIVCRTNIGS